MLMKMFNNEEKNIKRLNKIVDKIEILEDKFNKISDDEFSKLTLHYKERVSNGEKLDDLLPEVFATIREAAKRVLGIKHYRVQLIGGIVLHEGRIAEMKTGEGKTLVATLPAYLNSLTGKGVHIVTTNDYLAKRDKEDMSKLYEFLGVSVGVIINGQSPNERKNQYNCDITYGTNNEYGFDYLRDNMAMDTSERVQGILNYAIIDEIDSILIDEARTPLIISGQGEKSTNLYLEADKFIQEINEKHYHIDEKRRVVSLTEGGILKAEDYFSVSVITDLENMELYHHINQALKAHKIMKKDKDYVCKNEEIIIVDEFTGRMMDGRRYSDGLHQAIEAKEGIKVNSESKTLATITFQNYFKMYKKLSGMTGTCKTEEDEFKEIYSLDIVQIPTNKPIQRIDLKDEIFTTETEKLKAIGREVVEKHSKKQPILVGVSSIEDSEKISMILMGSGVPHRVLNAKYHKKEAEIIAQAGRIGAVTIATNMAGRGTDILLGGNPIFLAKQKMKELGYPEGLINILHNSMSLFIHNENLYNCKRVYEGLYQKYRYETKCEAEKIRELGGLAVIGAERYESRRVDDQLRGRAGRQGDPGITKFYISLEDKIIKIAGKEKMKDIANKFEFKEGEPIFSTVLAKSIESIQKQIESSNFVTRKDVVKYDEIVNKQRQIIYKQRKEVLESNDIRCEIEKIIYGLIENCVNYSNSNDSYDLEYVSDYIKEIFSCEGILEIENSYDLDGNKLVKEIYENILEKYLEKEALIGRGPLRNLERMILLKSVDKYWSEHLDSMQKLRQGIALRSLGQKDPVMEYTNEGFDMFNEMIKNIQENTLQSIFKICVKIIK